MVWDKFDGAMILYVYCLGKDNLLASVKSKYFKYVSVVYCFSKGWELLLIRKMTNKRLFRWLDMSVSKLWKENVSYTLNGYSYAIL